MSEWREDIEAVRTLGLWRVLYLRFVYQHHMRFIHQRGGHQMKKLHPMGGPSFSRCDWCGHMEFDALQTNDDGKVSLAWKSQFASQDRGCTDVMHWANSQAGRFEVFETGEHFLLHFPRQLSQPSELFDSLGGAKSRAEEAAHLSSKGNKE